MKILLLLLLCVAATPVSNALSARAGKAAVPSDDECEAAMQEAMARRGDNAKDPIRRCKACILVARTDGGGRCKFCDGDGLNNAQCFARGLNLWRLGGGRRCQNMKRWIKGDDILACESLARPESLNMAAETCSRQGFAKDKTECDHRRRGRLPLRKCVWCPDLHDGFMDKRGQSDPRYRGNKCVGNPANCALPPLEQPPFEVTGFNDRSSTFDNSASPLLAEPVEGDRLLPPDRLTVERRFVEATGPENVYDLLVTQGSGLASEYREFLDVSSTKARRLRRLSNIIRYRRQGFPQRHMRGYEKWMADTHSANPSILGFLEIVQRRVSEIAEKRTSSLIGKLSGDANPPPEIVIAEIKARAEAVLDGSKRSFTQFLFQSATVLGGTRTDGNDSNTASAIKIVERGMPLLGLALTNVVSEVVSRPRAQLRSLLPPKHYTPSALAATNDPWERFRQNNQDDISTPHPPGGWDLARELQLDITDMRTAVDVYMQAYLHFLQSVQAMPSLSLAEMKWALSPKNFWVHTTDGWRLEYPEDQQWQSLGSYMQHGAAYLDQQQELLTSQMRQLSPDLDCRIGLLARDEVQVEGQLEHELKQILRSASSLHHVLSETKSRLDVAIDLKLEWDQDMKHQREGRRREKEQAERIDVIETIERVIDKAFPKLNKAMEILLDDSITVKWLAHRITSSNKEHISWMRKQVGDIRDAQRPELERFMRQLQAFEKEVKRLVLAARHNPDSLEGKIRHSSNREHVILVALKRGKQVVEGAFALRNTLSWQKQTLSDAWEERYPALYYEYARKAKPLFDGLEAARVVLAELRSEGLRFCGQLREVLEQGK